MCSIDSNQVAEALLCVVLAGGDGGGDGEHRHRDDDEEPHVVDVDLRHGIVKGYSAHVRFLASPSPTDDDRCAARAVLAVQLAPLSRFNRVRLSLDYSAAEPPRLWTLDVSDSPRADGYGTSHSAMRAHDDNNSSSSSSSHDSMAETHVRASFTF